MLRGRITEINNQLVQNLKVDKDKYDRYKFKFLTYKNSKPTKPNYKIIKDLMDQLTYN